MTQGLPQHGDNNGEKESAELPAYSFNVNENGKVIVRMMDGSFVVLPEDAVRGNHSNLSKEEYSKLLLRFYPSIAHEYTRVEMPKIDAAPGYGVFKMLAFFCSKKTVELVIEPLHAEYLTEYYDALQKKQHRKAMVIKGKMRFFLFYSVVSSKLASVVGKVIQAALKAKI